MTLKILDLFSGIGGFSLGLEATGHFETKAFCEIEPFCQQVLKKNFPGVPIFDDIRTLKGTDIGAIDIITGGYPCQPFSVAGKQKAEQDPRHLWPEYFRLIQELKPTWVIGENVSGHIKLGLDSVLEDLESEGYSTRTFSISASSIGANHKRERVWTIANLANSERLGWTERSKKSEEFKREESSDQFDNSSKRLTESKPSQDVADSKSIGSDVRENRKYQEESRHSWEIGSEIRGVSSNVADTSFESINSFSNSRSNSKIDEQSREKTGFSDRKSGGETDMADSNSERLQRQRESSNQFSQKSTSTKSSKKRQEGLGREWWEFEPRVGRVAHGIPKRVDRLKSLGNAVVPHIPYYIGQAIIESYQ